MTGSVSGQQVEHFLCISNRDVGAPRAAHACQPSTRSTAPTALRHRSTKRPHQEAGQPHLHPACPPRLPQARPPAPAAPPRGPPRSPATQQLLLGCPGWRAPHSGWLRCQRQGTKAQLGLRQLPWLPGAAGWPFEGADMRAAASRCCSAAAGGCKRGPPCCCSTGADMQALWLPPCCSREAGIPVRGWKRGVRAPSSYGAAGCGSSGVGGQGQKDDGCAEGAAAQ